MPGGNGAVDFAAGPADPEQPVNPAGRLGKKGLKYKDRATQLGLCAASAGLVSAGLRDASGPLADGAGIGVVVSSNYGNVDTVCRVVATIAAETTRGTSPMDGPNASSNIIASEIAIRYKLAGPNLTVCNGAASGRDALHWAAGLLRADRADHVLVIGVEPDNDMVRTLVGAGRVVDGAVALVLERAGTARTRDAEVRARVGGYVRAGGVEDCVGRLDSFGAPHGWYPPETGSAALSERVLAGVPRFALSDAWGVLSGAFGVAQCAAAVGRFDAGERGPIFALAGRDDDGVAGCVLLAPEDHA
jgi:3-oxoacyl-[acyl-carrier-protein] synthase II